MRVPVEIGRGRAGDVAEKVAELNGRLRRVPRQILSHRYGEALFGGGHKDAADGYAGDSGQPQGRRVDFERPSQEGYRECAIGGAGRRRMNAVDRSNQRPTAQRASQAMRFGREERVRKIVRKSAVDRVVGKSPSRAADVRFIDDRRGRDSRCPEKVPEDA